MNNNLNISSLSNINLINSAKNQLDNKTKENNKIINNRVDELNKEIEDLNQKQKNIDSDYNDKFKKLEQNYKSGYLSEEEKNQEYNKLQNQKNQESKLITENIDKLKNDLSNEINDPLKSAKDKEKKISNKIDQNIKNTKSGSRKSNIQRNKQVISNLKKSLAPIIMNQLTNVLIQVVNQNGKLQDLVNQTNDYIDKSNTKEDINQSIILRNTALNIINNQELKLKSLKDTTKMIKTVVDISSIVLQILLAIPVPTSTPPGIGIPLNIITKISRAIEKANSLIESLSVVLSIINPTIEQLINNLEDLKNQLHEINNIIEDKATSVVDNNPYSNKNLNFSDYKGFKFFIKEENNPKFIVNNNKRHYAVAINNGVEIFQSEYSFTLDPNDLIEQLKLKIDSLFP